MEHSLQKKAFWGLVWGGLEKFASQMIYFVVGIALARVLNPSDYGLVGMLSVFTALASCMLDTGMGNALVRKLDHTDLDCSTVFYFNMAVSCLIYAAMYLLAPLIADFYDQPILCDLTRFITLSFIIGPLGAIQQIKFTIALNFKTPSLITVVTAVATGTTGVIAAYRGCGVWALAYSSVAGTLCRTVLLWILGSWRPRLVFSWISFRELFGFGSKLLASSMLDTAYNNIRPLLIGKLYSGTELGYFSRANQYAQLPSTTVTGLLGRVSFPLLCRFQDNDMLLQEKYRLMIRLSSFIVFPVLVGLAAVAYPFVVVLITGKWLPCVPFLQILCFALMWYPVHALNLNILQVKGRSDLFLRLEVIKKILVTIVLLITVPISVTAMCYGSVATSLIALFINTYYTGKLIQVGFGRQMLDILPSLALSLFMGGIVWLLATWLPFSETCRLVTGIVTGIVIYVGGAGILRFPELKIAVNLIRNNLRPS